MTLAAVLDEIRRRPGTSEMIPIFNPSIGEQIGEFADGGVAAVERLDAGMITLNCQMVWDPALPIGGHKQSGWGYEYGIEGIEAYMQTKSVYTQL